MADGCHGGSTAHCPAVALRVFIQHLYAYTTNRAGHSTALSFCCGRRMPEVTVDVSWSLDQPISTSRGDVVARAMVESCTVDLVNTSDWRWSLATEDGEVLAELTTVTEEPLEARRMDDPRARTTPSLV